MRLTRHIQRTIQATGQVGDIDVKSKLLREHIELLIGAVICHEIHT
jgi:hypothetical protein